MRPLTSCRLYGILDTGYCAPENMPAMLRQMIAGGIHIVQLRAKGFAPDRIREIGRELLPLSREAGVPLVINDYPDIAGEIGADGAHVGQDDLSVAEARYLAGPQCFIGKSTHSLAQADAGVFHRVVLVDVEVAAGGDAKIERAMLGQEFQHVVEEADARFDVSLARSIEVQLEVDLGFVGLALNSGSAAHWFVAAVCGSETP